MSDQQPKSPDKPSGPVVVGNLNIQIDRDLCIGAATCMAIATKTFVVDSAAKAIVLNTAVEESEENIIDAAKGCPTSAISIKDKDGNSIFPK